MNNELLINNKIFKKLQINENYYISENGDVYSLFSKRILKGSIDKDGYKRVDININGKPKHFKVHKLVYLTWIGNINKGEQINHKDDNKLNNHYSNLYIGSQKENIQDCIKNNHRVGNIQVLTIKEIQTNEILTFSPIYTFFEYVGRTQANGSIQRVLKRNWFKERFEFISIEKV